MDSYCGKLKSSIQAGASRPVDSLQFRRSLISATYAITLSVLLSLTGCTKTVESLDGRWLQQQSELSYDFGKFGWCAQVNPSSSQVVIFQYSNKDSKLHLNPITKGWWQDDGKVLRARPVAPLDLSYTLSGSSLVLEQSGSRQKFDRAKVVSPATGTEVGLWKYTGYYRQDELIEFTPQGTVLSVSYFQYDPRVVKFRKRLYEVGYFGQWFRYRRNGNDLEMEGYSQVPRLQNWRLKISKESPDQLVINDRGRYYTLYRQATLPELKAQEMPVKKKPETKGR